MANIGSLRLDGRSYRLDMGRRGGDDDYVSRTYVHSGPGDVSPDRSMGYISFTVNKGVNDPVLSGLWLSPDVRGNGVGSLMMEIALRISDVFGPSLLKTGIIRKPQIALLLQKFGYVAENNNVVAQLLPGHANLPPDVNLEITGKSVGSVMKGLRPEWMTVVGNTIDPSLEVPSVSLYTRYRVGDLGVHVAERERVSANLDGRIKVFPRRVRGAI